MTAFWLGGWGTQAPRVPQRRSLCGPRPAKSAFQRVAGLGHTSAMSDTLQASDLDDAGIVATREDVARLETRLVESVPAVEIRVIDRIAQLELRLATRDWRLFGGMVAIIGLAVAILKLG